VACRGAISAEPLSAAAYEGNMRVAHALDLLGCLSNVNSRHIPVVDHHHRHVERLST
jgi:hypothetical protein